MDSIIRKLTITAMMIFTLSTVLADITLSNVFSDNMVLQSGKAVPIWGWAAKGSVIKVSFAGQTKETTVDENGRWSVKLDPMNVCKEGRKMTVEEFLAGNKPGKKLIVENILIGEVWILSGQSNMQWTVNGTDDYKKVLTRANYPLMRYMRNNEGAVSFKPAKQSPAAARWVVTTTNEVGSYSATGFYFGERLMLDRDVPVGLIMTACGGTSMANWTPREWLTKDPMQSQTLKRYERESEEWIATNGYANAIADHMKAIQKYAEDLHDHYMKKGAYPWPRPTPPFAVTPWPPNRTPCVHYNAKIAPLAGLAIAGVLWYQGESESWAWNEHDPAAKFHGMLSVLIRGWREAWGEDIPFVMAELPSMAANDKLNFGWPVVRCRQQQVSDELPNVGTAPILDTGWEHDVHPHDKTLVGERLCRVARRMVYGESSIAMPPKFSSVELTEKGAVLRISSEAKIVERGSPRGFQLKFGNEWIDATPKLRPDGTVFVASPEGYGRPSAVHYLWKSWDKPDVWLYDSQGVPISSYSYPFMVR